MLDQESRWMASVKENNNKAAFQALYQRYKTPVLSYLSCRLREKAQAEELFQEAFLKLFRFRKSYDPQKKFSSWFWTIVKNTLYDFLRKTQKSPSLSELSFDSEDTDFKEEEGKDWNTPELECLKKSELKQIDFLLRNIKERDQDIFLLRIFSEQKFEEIAESYKIPPSTVRVSFHRTKKYLLDNIEREFDKKHEKQ